MTERIWLARDLLVKCWTIAKKRDAIKDPSTNQQVSSRPGFEIHFDGLRAEAAVAQYVGQPELVDWSVQRHGDGGRDLLLPIGTTQVKASTYIPPLLRFNIEGSQTFKADFAVLAYVPLAPKEFDAQWCERDGYVELIGMISREEFFQRAVKMNFGYGDRLVVEAPFPLAVSSLRGGFVGYDEKGRFLHYCKCGKWGSTSVGAFTHKGILGKWYCQEHHPDERFRHPG